MANMKPSKRKFLYKHMVFRSSYEVAYARFLDSRKISWNYEPIFTLSNGTSIIPDFQLDDGSIVEIKGYFRPDAKLKWDMFCSEYPNLNKVLLTKTELKKLSVI